MFVCSHCSLRSLAPQRFALLCWLYSWARPPTPLIPSWVWVCTINVINKDNRVSWCHWKHVQGWLTLTLITLFGLTLITSCSRPGICVHAVNVTNSNNRVSCHHWKHAQGWSTLTLITLFGLTLITSLRAQDREYWWAGNGNERLIARTHDQPLFDIR